MLSSKATLADLPADLAGKRVLIRVDFNVPMKDGQVTDKTRITSTFPTIRAILAKKPRSVILMSHLGRPDGAKKSEFSLQPVAAVLKELLAPVVVEFVYDCVGADVARRCQAVPEGAIVLLENLRFYGEEEGSAVIDGKKVKIDKSKISDFSSQLTQLGDVFVNDAFGTAHRAHASMVGVELPIRVAGNLMEKEIASFAKALENPKKPRLAILGGAKVRDKIQLIDHLIDSFADAIIIGGGMAFTFSKVLDQAEIGSSLFDEEGAKIVRAIVDKAAANNVKIHLPVDWIAADKFANDANTATVSLAQGIPANWMGLDIGPKTISNFAEVIKTSNTIVWNGPVGVFEFPRFASGSNGVLDAIIANKAAVSIVGGGDTAAFVEGTGKASQVSHVSTGGGASLELLEGKILPGVNALSNKA